MARKTAPKAQIAAMLQASVRCSAEKYGNMAINDIQRSRRAVGADTAHLDVRRGARTGRRTVGLHAGSLSGQGCVDVGDTARLQVNAFHRRHGSREGTLPLDAVTNHNHFVQQIRIHFQSHIDDIAVGHHLCGHVADA